MANEDAPIHHYKVDNWLGNYGAYEVLLPRKFRVPKGLGFNKVPGGRWKVRALRDGTWVAYTDDYFGFNYHRWLVFSTFEFAILYASIQAKTAILSRNPDSSCQAVRNNYLVYCLRSAPR